MDEIRSAYANPITLFKTSAAECDVCLDKSNMGNHLWDNASHIIRGSGV